MLSVIRQRRLFRHKRLGAGLLLSVLVHAMLLAPPSTSPVVTLMLPAPELAVAFAVGQRRAESRPELQPLPRSPEANETDAAEPQQLSSFTPSASATATNHLRSLLHESLNQHFIYPPVAHRNGWEGRVELLVHLDRDGRLHGMRVMHSSGYPLLDDDALLTLRRIGSIPRARAWLSEQGYATTLPIVYKLTEG